MLLASLPGILRDGTRLHAEGKWIEGQWMRFWQDVPRKMLGYREQLRNIDGIIRQFDVQSYDGFTYVHAGTQDVLQRYTIDLNSGLPSGLIDRTPTGFVASVNNNWQFTVVYNTANNSNLLLAHAAPNIQDISNTTERLVYFGEVRDTAALLPITGSEVSGGIVAMWPYFVRYGNDGEVAWPAPGNLTDLTGTGSGSARPCGNKIVKGLPLRGTSGPAVLMWSLDSLVRMQFVGGDAIFTFDTITTSSALLSSNSVIEHAGIYYWATVSGFAMFNGVMRMLPNEDNTQFFLDNLNYPYRQKVFAYKVPRWNEIWWCFPKGDATECNHAIIFNYMKGYWYDTPLPSAGRTAGMYEQIYNYPIMASPVVNEDTSGTSTWQHEFGLDEISGAAASSKAIKAFILTHEYNLIVPQGQGSGQNRNLSYNVLEPDFDQVGDLLLYTETRANARAPIVFSEPKVIPAVYSPNEQTIKLKHTGRLTAFKIETNTLGGNMIWGRPLLHVAPSDARTQS
jgi:hypothetical protein